MHERHVTVVGAGLAGSLLAIYLAQKEFEVEVYERRPDMRLTDISAGRSINLALSTRGIHALEEVGLKEKIMQIAIPMKGRMMHAPDGELSFHRYGKDDTEVINSVSRGDLNRHLMDAAEAHGVRIRFEMKCTGLDFKTGSLALQNERTGEARPLQTSPVIATDGSASAIRTDMLKVGRCNFSQDYLEHGYKELTIPPGTNGAFQLEKNALHIWPRKRYMLIALPNLDGSFTCTLFFPFEGDPSFATLQTERDVLTFFETQFPDALPLMPTLLEDYFSNPTGSLVTIKCQPWHTDGQACLLGDAAHAIVPFFGQGMNCAFEDCTVFNECLDQHEGNWNTTFKAFETHRKKHTDAIAEMALENYFEMRDHVANPKFLLKKELEFALEERFAERFIPRYSMVSFHRIPYAVARARGAIQEDILTQLAADIEQLEEVDWRFAERLVREKLEPVEETE